MNQMWNRENQPYYCRSSKVHQVEKNVRKLQVTMQKYAPVYRTLARRQSTSPGVKKSTPY